MSKNGPPQALKQSARRLEQKRRYQAKVALAKATGVPMLRERSPPETKRARARDKPSVSSTHVTNIHEMFDLSPTVARALSDRDAQLRQSDLETETSNPLVEGLKRLAESDHSPAQARVSAARTVLEVEGRLGRHAKTPAPNTTAPLGLLSRDELVRELDRLRRMFKFS